MAHIMVFRVLQLPAQLEPSAFYYVRNGNKAEAYLTNKNGELFPITNTAAIAEQLANITAGDVEAYDPGDVTLMFDNALV